MAPELPPPPYTSLTMTWRVAEAAACAGATPPSAAAIVASAASPAAARRGRTTPPRTWIGSDGSTGIVAVRMIHPLLGPQYRGRPWWWVLDLSLIHISEPTRLGMI